MKSLSIFVCFLLVASILLAATVSEAFSKSRPSKQREKLVAQFRNHHGKQFPSDTQHKTKIMHPKKDHPQLKRLSNTTNPRLVDWVWTIIGTGGLGWGQISVNPGAQVPNGVLRLGPDTSLGLEPLRIPFDSEGGYFWYDGQVGFLECFSHTHVEGAGETDWMNFGFTMVRMNQSSSSAPPIATETIINAGYKSRFNHDTETARPGLYSVNLDTHNVFAEMTATGTLTGMQRYTCNPGSSVDCALVIDVAHGSPRTNHLFDFGYAIRQAEIITVNVAADGQSANITARVLNAGEFLDGAKPLGGINIWLHAQIYIETQPGFTSDTRLGDMSFWQNQTFLATNSSQIFQQTTSGSSGIVIPWLNSSSTTNSKLVIRSGLSFISPQFAHENLLDQQYLNNNKQFVSFSNAVANIQNEWETILRQFYINADTTKYDEWMAAFYTGVYESNLAPSDYTEHNGYFVGLDNQIHQNPSGQRRLSDLSTWDTYRTQQPLMIFSRPDINRDTTNSVVQMSVEGESAPMSNPNYFPKWVMANVETYVMCGMHSVVSALESVVKGVPGITNPQLLFDKAVRAVRTQNQNMPSHGSFGHYSLHTGYCTGAGGTLEFAIDAAAVRNAALKVFNNQSIADEMEPYANAYRNLFNPDPSIQFFCNRDTNGTFVCPKNPVLPHPWEEGGFIESNAIQYRWYAPGNVSDLVSLFSSVPDAAGFLETYFVDTWFWPFNTTLPNPFYWGGNEPTMLTPFEFNYMGNEYAHRTNKWLREIMQKLFFYGADSFAGNSDYGALPSGQVFMYLGFYPVPPTTQYALYAPWYSHTEIRLPVTNGQPLRAAVRLVAFNHVPGVVNYLVNAEVNGRNMTTPFVSHEELMNVVPQGGTPTIFFYCTQTPVVYGDVSQTKKPWMPKELSDDEKEFRKAQVEKLGAKVWDMFKN